MIALGNTARIAYPSHIEAASGSEISTALLWTRVWRRRWLITITSLILFGLFTTIIFLLPTWYTAEAEIVIEQRPQGVDLAAVLSRIPTDSQAVLTEAEMVRSRALAQQTINQLGLSTNPEFNPRIIPRDGSLRSQWRKAKAAGIAFIESLLPRSAKLTSGDPVLNEATDIFLKNLRVTPMGRSQVLKVAYTSESPELASKVLNTLVDVYLKTQMENRLAVPNKVTDFMKGELNRLQVKARTANEAAERYRNQAKLQQGIVQGRETLLYTQELSEANSQLIAVRIKKQAAEARLSEVKAHPNSFSDVLASAPLQQLRHQLSLLKESQSQLITTYGPSYPQVRQVDASIADGERRLNAEISKVVRSIEGDVAVLTEQEAQLVQSVAINKAEMQNAGDARVTLASLEQEAAVNQTILTTFLTRYNQLTSQHALQIADSYVLARADIPTKPSFPLLLPLAGIAFLISVALPMALALLLERTGETIRSSREVEPLLTTRSLGIIPKLKTKAALLTQVIDDPQSPFTESIRSVLSRVMAPRNLGRAVLIASAQPREGRTSLAVALARLAALSGQRVILIDCDLRSPALHSAFGGGMGPGLTDFLQKRIELGKVVRKDALTSLAYISGGALTPHAANLLCLPEMGKLLAKLRSEYDLLILDSPPSAAVADTNFIAQMSDECLFVVGWNKTSWRLVREQMNDLSRHCSVTGVVLNQVDMRKHSEKAHPVHVKALPAPTIIETSA